MARSIAFNREEVLDKAVQVFWAKGYEATSMQDLVDAMGIQRGSLYGTFGGKQRLFLTALNRYGDVVVKSLLSLLESEPSAKDSINSFFAQLVEHLMTAGPLRSCLVTNSAIERGLTDEATREKIFSLLNAIEKGFYQALLRARENNEISTNIDLTATAYYLTSSMQGLIVMGKICHDRSVLESINQMTLSIFE